MTFAWGLLCTSLTWISVCKCLHISICIWKWWCYSSLWCWQKLNLQNHCWLFVREAIGLWVPLEIWTKNNLIDEKFIRVLCISCDCKNASEVLSAFYVSLELLETLTTEIDSSWFNLCSTWGLSDLSYVCLVFKVKLKWPCFLKIMTFLVNKLTDSKIPRQLNC